MPGPDTCRVARDFPTWGCRKAANAFPFTLAPEYVFDSTSRGGVNRLYLTVNVNQLCEGSGCGKKLYALVINSDSKECRNRVGALTVLGKSRVHAPVWSGDQIKYPRINLDEQHAAGAELVIELPKSGKCSDLHKLAGNSWTLSFALSDEDYDYCPTGCFSIPHGNGNGNGGSGDDGDNANGDSEDGDKGGGGDDKGSSRKAYRRLFNVV